MTCARRPAGAQRPAPAPSAGSPRNPEPRSGRRRARLSGFLPALALLLGALSPFAAAPAQAQTLITVWEATLTVGVDSGQGWNGCWDSLPAIGRCRDSTSLTEREITIPGSSPGRINMLMWNSAVNQLRINFYFSGETDVTAFKNAFIEGTLYVDGDAFFVSAVRFHGHNEIRWPYDPATDWTAGQQVRLRLATPASPTVSNLRATPGDRRLTVSWTGPSVSGDTAIRGYDVYYREAVCTKPKRWNAGNNDFVPEFRDGVRVYEYCDPNDRDKPGPWVHHGGWAGSWDPIARQTTRVIDGLWPGVAYDVRVRVRTNKRDFPYHLARGTPSGGSNNARLLQIELIADQLLPLQQ